MIIVGQRRHLALAATIKQQSLGVYMLYMFPTSIVSAERDDIHRPSPFR
jgi:hypothetical protein